MRMLESLALLAALAVSLSQAHVGLVFPAARKYDLDFLDNLRTKAPCGMPKGKLINGGEKIRGMKLFVVGPPSSARPPAQTRAAKESKP